MNTVWVRFMWSWYGASSVLTSDDAAFADAGFALSLPALFAE
jgi:hypothetical protein